MELGVVEIIVIVELCIAPDGVKSVMFRAIRDSAQAVPGAQWSFSNGTSESA